MLSYSFFLLKATVKTALSVTSVQHSRAYLKTANISTVCEGNGLQTGRKSLQCLLTHRAGTFWESAAVSLVTISTQCTKCQVPSTAQDVLDGWDLHMILSISYLNPGSGHEGRVSEWPEGWAGTCPGEQPGSLAVAKPHQYLCQPLWHPLQTPVSAGQDTWVTMLPSWDQTHATSLFRELPGFWAFSGYSCL